jgi:hypothetical protein
MGLELSLGKWGTNKSFVRTFFFQNSIFAILWKIRWLLRTYFLFFFSLNPFLANEMD